MNISRAVRAYYGLTEDRHPRLALIGALDRVVDVTTAAALDALSDDDLQELPPSVTDWPFLSSGELASIVRDAFATFYPDRVMRLDMTLLENAVVAWQNASGRPRAGEASSPKYEALVDLLDSADLLELRPRRADAESDVAAERRRKAEQIKREWQKHSGEVPYTRKRFDRERSVKAGGEKRRELIRRYEAEIVAARESAKTDDVAVVIIAVTDGIAMEAARSFDIAAERNGAYVFPAQKESAIGTVAMFDRTKASELAMNWGKGRRHVLCVGYLGCNVIAWP